MDHEQQKREHVQSQSEKNGPSEICGRQPFVPYMELANQITTW